MRLGLEGRGDPSILMNYASPLIAAALTVLCGLILFSALGKGPLEAFYAFFISPISSMYGFGELLIKASPLVLIAMGLAIGFRANVWNIGAEGQLTVGAIAASGIALTLNETQSSLLLPAMIVAGAVGGMSWAAIPAFLRTRFNVNEILVSLMFTYVALLLLTYLVHGPWRDPLGYNFPQSELFSAAARYPILVSGTRLNASVIIVVITLVLGWLFLSRSFLGYQMLVVGLAQPAARYAGFNIPRLIWLGMLSGGAAAGVAGVGEVAGPLGQLMPTLSPGYGFAAIIVAFLGRLHPLGILLVGLLMSLLHLGGEAAQIDLNMPSAVTGVFQGLLLFFLLGAEVFVRYRLRIWLPEALAPKSGRDS